MHDGGKSAAITVLENGPYLVSGGVPLALTTIAPDAEGGSWEWTEGRAIEGGEKYALCRCGLSANKPLCDGTHAKAGFDGTETVSRAPHRDQATVTECATLVLEDADPLCAVATRPTIRRHVQSCGPLDVRGGIPVASADGTPYETRNRVTLCRCGKLENKPFCDGSHTSGWRDDLA